MPPKHQPSAPKRLTETFHRNGYVRAKNPVRHKEEGSSHYKKGFEVRLIARDEEEMAALVAALQEEGFSPGTPYAKARQWAIPLYGRRQVERFLRLVKAEQRLVERQGSAAPSREAES